MIYLHAVSRTSTGSNVLGSPLVVINLVAAGLAQQEVVGVHGLIGRGLGATYGQATWQTLGVQSFVENQGSVDTLLAIWRAQQTGAMLCVRENFGNRIFGRISEPEITTMINGFFLAFQIEEADYTESL